MSQDEELDAILQNLGKSLEIISGRELEGAIMLLSAKQAIKALYRQKEKDAQTIGYKKGYIDGTIGLFINQQKGKQ